MLSRQSVRVQMLHHGEDVIVLHQSIGRVRAPAFSPKRPSSVEVLTVIQLVRFRGFKIHLTLVPNGGARARLWDCDRLCWKDLYSLSPDELYTPVGLALVDDVEGLTIKPFQQDLNWLLAICEEILR